VEVSNSYLIKKNTRLWAKALILEHKQACNQRARRVDMVFSNGVPPFFVKNALQEHSDAKAQHMEQRVLKKQTMRKRVKLSLCLAN
jgi:hypothetical protein